MNYLPEDQNYQLLLSSLSFFAPTSVNYAGMLNEIGRYLQGKQIISPAILFYQQSIELFESNRDYVNSCLVVCNLAKLLHLAGLPPAYNCLRWMNSHIDSILLSSCSQTLKQTVIAIIQYSCRHSLNMWIVKFSLFARC